jgi:hypothetical protein
MYFKVGEGFLNKSSIQDFQKQQMQSSCDWRVNQYMEFLSSSFFGPLKSFLLASFVEWKYLAVSTKNFKGIVGISWFNPKAKFSSLAEGGLLLILSGELHAENSQPADFCWMKRFDEKNTKVNFGCLECFQDDVQLSLIQHNNENISVSISIEKELSFEASFVSQSLPVPIVAEQHFKSHPYFIRKYTHWIVNNAMPVCNVFAEAFFSGLFLKKINQGVYGDESFFKINNAQLQMPHGFTNYNFKTYGKGYVEHSFGVCPMPLFGWDFCFSPGQLNKHDGFVMQLYRGSQSIRCLDFLYQQNEVKKIASFKNNEFECTWEDYIFDKEIKKNVPLVRKIKAENNFFRAECTVKIRNRIPFLREKSFFVKHFFISEETSQSHWSLTDKFTNHVVASENFSPSGGETAQSRWWYPVLGSAWDHSSMGTSKLHSSVNTVSAEIEVMHS